MCVCVAGLVSLTAGGMSTCDHCRFRYLTALRDDWDAFFLYYKDDFNFEHELVSSPDVIEKQIEEEEENDYPNVRHIFCIIANQMMITFLLQYGKLEQQLALSKEVHKFYGSRNEPYYCYKVRS